MEPRPDAKPLPRTPEIAPTRAHRRIVRTLFTVRVFSVHESPPTHTSRHTLCILYSVVYTKDACVECRSMMHFRMRMPYVQPTQQLLAPLNCHI